MDWMGFERAHLVVCQCLRGLLYLPFVAAGQFPDEFAHRRRQQDQVTLQSVRGLRLAVGQGVLRHHEVSGRVLALEQLQALAGDQPDLAVRVRPDPGDDAEEQRDKRQQELPVVHVGVAGDQDDGQAGDVLFDI